MFNINKYLEKFSKNINSTEIQTKQILEIIEKHIETKVSEGDIEIKNYILYLKSSPSVKNKVFVYKNKILKDISSLSDVKIVDIK